MPSTYYDSANTGAQIDAAVTAVNNVQDAANNGKIVVIKNGVLDAEDLDDIIPDYSEKYW